MPNFNEIYKCWSWYIRYPLAFALFLFSLFLRFHTLPLQAGLAYVTFYPAVIIAFYLFGAGPGATVALISGLAGTYFFVPPHGELSTDLKTYLSLPYFYLTSFLIGYVVTRLHATVDFQQRQKSKLERLQRIYMAAIETDKLISKKLEPSSLFEEVTRIAVEYGGMKLAWIGTFDQRTETIIPVSSYGDE